jgi:hypothetical protein
MQCAQIVDCELTGQSAVTNYLAQVQNHFLGILIGFRLACEGWVWKWQNPHKDQKWSEGRKARNFPIDQS